MNQLNKILISKLDKLQENFEQLIISWQTDIENPIYVNKINDLFNALDVYNDNMNNLDINNYSNKDILDKIVPIIYGIKN